MKMKIACYYTSQALTIPAESSLPVSRRSRRSCSFDSDVGGEDQNFQCILLSPQRLLPRTAPIKVFIISGEGSVLVLTYKARAKCLVAPLTGEQRHQESAAVMR
jgi:hypothetical protein